MSCRSKGRVSVLRQSDCRQLWRNRCMYRWNTEGAFSIRLDVTFRLSTVYCTGIWYCCRYFGSTVCRSFGSGSTINRSFGSTVGLSDPDLLLCSTVDPSAHTHSWRLWSARKIYLIMFARWNLYDTVQAVALRKNNMYSIYSVPCGLVQVESLKKVMSRKFMPFLGDGFW